MPNLPDCPPGFVLAVRNPALGPCIIAHPQHPMAGQRIEPGDPVPIPEDELHDNERNGPEGGGAWLRYTAPAEAPAKPARKTDQEAP